MCKIAQESWQQVICWCILICVCFCCTELYTIFREIIMSHLLRLTACFSNSCHFNMFIVFISLIWVVTILLVSLSLYLSSWGSLTSAADAKWHATAAHSANREIGRPTRSSAVSVNGFWPWNLSLNDDPFKPQFEERWSQGVRGETELKCKNWLVG